jgi:polyisoprenoid-binding protein YceI
VTQTATPTRNVAGVELPARGDWKIDPTHSTVEFVGRHLMVSKVRGRFTDLDGVIHVAEDPSDSSVEVTIRTDSLDSRDPQRDAHLRSDEMFDIERYPTMTFRSTKVEGESHEWKVSGDLTIKDITRPVVLDVEYTGVVSDPWGGQRAGFSATAEVDREDWGINWNVALEAGGWLVSKKIRLEIEVEAIFAP